MKTQVTITNAKEIVHIQSIAHARSLCRQVAPDRVVVVV